MKLPSRFILASSVLAASVVPAHAVIILDSVSYVGQKGVDAQVQAGNGSPAFPAQNQDLLITGASFTGGQGGYGSNLTIDVGSGPMTIPGNGGNGGLAVSFSGGNSIIHNGIFTSGIGGGGDSTSGVAGGVIQLSGGATVLIDGGTFSFGGATSAPMFDVGGNSTLTLNGDFGALAGQTLTGTGDFTGKLLSSSSPQTFSYSVAPGSTLQFVPESSAAVLAFASAGLLLRRRRN